MPLSSHFAFTYGSLACPLCLAKLHGGPSTLFAPFLLVLLEMVRFASCSPTMRVGDENFEATPKEHMQRETGDLANDSRGARPREAR